MSKTSKAQEDSGNEMLPEYDFTGGVRGKHSDAYREGHEVRIHKRDGSVEVHHYTLEEGAVMLEPAVQEYFPDSQSVNRALRSLITLIPRKRAAASSR